MSVLTCEMPAGAGPGDIPHDPTLRVVRVLAPPEKTGSALARAALEALGRRDDVRGAGSRPGTEWRLVRQWVTAHRTERVVVLSAQDVTARNMHTLAGAVLAAGADLVLVADTGQAEALRTGARNFTPRQVDWQNLAPGLHRAPTPSPAVPAPAVPADARLPQPADLPAEPWPGFRSACRTNLPPREAAAVDAVYDTALVRAYEWLDGNEPLVGRTRVSVDKAALTAVRDGVLALLERASDEHTQQSALVVAMHATSAAFSTRGLLFSFVPSTLLRTLGSGMVPRPPAPDDWVLLRGFRVPWHAAVCVLVGLGATREHCRQVRCGDVSQDGTAVAVNGQPVDVPSGAAPYLRGQLLHRAEEGALAQDPFVPEATTALRVGLVLDAARSSLGIRLGLADVRSHRHQERWKDRVGFSVEVAR